MALTIDEVLGYKQSDWCGVELQGAYGRSYMDKKTAKADWFAGKDFKMLSGPYCSIRDCFRLKMMANYVTILNRNGEKLITIPLNEKA